MEKHTIHTKAINRIFQILDGNFPSGSFVHSFGLEPHIIMQKVTTIDDLKLFLQNLIEFQYKGLDFVFVKKIERFLRQNKLSLLIKEDNNYSAMLPYEYAKASKELGENYLKQINVDIKKSIVKNYFEAISLGKSYGNELAILVAYAYELGINYRLFLSLWCKKNISNIALASLKISRIKPSQIQQMLFEFDDELDEMIAKSDTKLNSFNPLFEEVIYQHKSLEPKLFVT
jgi:urease accessory protein